MATHYLVSEDQATAMWTLQLTL